MRYKDATALVTGASSGIGREFAATLAARGANLVLVARREDELDALAVELRRSHGVTVTVVPVDLSRPNAASGLHETLVGQGITVSILVNCAGLATTGLFTDTAPEAVHNQLAINVIALTEITRAFVPGLLTAGEGAVVNIASVTGYHPTPGMAVYSASKAYVLNFTEALAYELRDSAVRVLALSPGPTRTEFYATSGSSDEGVQFQTPDEVVAAGLRALDAGHTPARVVSGARNRINVAVLRRLPRRTATALMAGSTTSA